MEINRPPQKKPTTAIERIKSSANLGTQLSEKTIKTNVINHTKRIAAAHTTNEFCKNTDLRVIIKSIAHPFLTGIIKKLKFINPIVSSKQNNLFTIIAILPFRSSSTSNPEINSPKKQATTKAKSSYLISSMTP